MVQFENTGIARNWTRNPQKSAVRGTIRTAAFFAVVALLTACGTTKEPGIEIREVPVPTPVACVKAELIPAEPETVRDQLTGEARHDLSVVAESALKLRKYAGELRALIAGCTE